MLAPLLPFAESTVFIPSAVYNIEEDIGELHIPVRRSGDVSQELMVVCYTQQGTQEEEEECVCSCQHLWLLVFPSSPSKYHSWISLYMQRRRW